MKRFTAYFPLEREKGFTLVEMLVALGITAVLFAALLSLFTTFTASSQTIQAHIQKSRGIQPGLDILMNDLEQICFHPTPGGSSESNLMDHENSAFLFWGTQTTAEGRSFSSLSFTSLNHIRFSTAEPDGMARITYYIYAHTDPSGKTRLDLHRADRLVTRDQTLLPCTDPVLFRNVTKFILTYTDEAQEAHQEWDSKNRDQNQTRPIPFQVDLQLSMAHEGDSQEEGSQDYRTTIFLPVSGEAQ